MHRSVLFLFYVTTILFNNNYNLNVLKNDTLCAFNVVERLQNKRVPVVCTNLNSRQRGYITNPARFSDQRSLRIPVAVNERMSLKIYNAVCEQGMDAIQSIPFLCFTVSQLPLDPWLPFP